MSYLPSVTCGIFEDELSWSTWWQLDEPRNEGQTLPWRSCQQNVGGPWYEYKNMIYCICILETIRHLMWQQIACHGKMVVDGKYKDVCPGRKTPGHCLNIKTLLWDMVMIQSYSYNGNPYTGKEISLYWDSPQIVRDCIDESDGWLFLNCWTLNCYMSLHAAWIVEHWIVTCHYMQHDKSTGRSQIIARSSKQHGSYGVFLLYFMMRWVVIS